MTGSNCTPNAREKIGVLSVAGKLLESVHKTKREAISSQMKDNYFFCFIEVESIINVITSSVVLHVHYLSVLFTISLFTILPEL